MIEKKKLIGSVVYELDPNDLLPEDSLEKIKSERLVGVVAVPRNPRSPFLFLGIIGAAVVIGVLTVFHITRSSSNEDWIKFRTSFPGSSGHLVEQEVVSSRINNIVEYYIRSSPSERVTIVDDFNKDIQIVKISKHSDDFCYISELKKGAYVRPSDLVFASQVDKTYVSQVFEADEKPVDDLTLLGDRGAELCQGIPVYWIRPFSETDTPISAANFTSTIPHSGSRSKRNIRSCYSSCCYSVCCCTVHHFTWEKADHFTCNHVCKGCTKLYKSSVRYLC